VVAKSFHFLISVCEELGLSQYSETVCDVPNFPLLHSFLDSENHILNLMFSST
jgi:hypothetical protein